MAPSLKLPGNVRRRASPRSLAAMCYLIACLGVSYYNRDLLMNHALAVVVALQPSNGVIPLFRTNSTKPKEYEHEWRRDGLLQVNPQGRHPIFDLIERAEAKWEAKLKNASKSLDEAVAEYRRRYGRLPPKGFDQWWAYVEEHGVQLPDEYDQIHRDLELFWSLRPARLRQIQHELEAVGYTYVIGKIDDHGVGILNTTLQGKKKEAHLVMANAFLDVLRPIEKLLPPFRAVLSPHDNPGLVLSWEAKQEALQAIKESRYMEPGDLRVVNRGWLSACAPDALARNIPYDLDHPPRPPTSKTFIWDHLEAMDPCAHPSHLHLHGQYIGLGTGPAPIVPFAPLFAFSTSPLHYDLRPASSFSWVYDVPTDTTWDAKQDDRLLWRGRNTGTWQGRNVRWKQQHRIRMMTKATAQEGEEEVILADTADQPLQRRKVARKALNAGLLDISFIHEPVQCEEPAHCSELRKMFKFLPWMEQDGAANYKYVMDIDGNGWSSRFKRLITSRSLIFKATAYPEWFADRLAPWVHYVPIQMDLSDLYDALVFFRGDERGLGGHEEMAKKIGLAGREWSLKFWRKEDMTAYMFRFMLEYARLMSDDREAASYQDMAEYW